MVRPTDQDMVAIEKIVCYSSQEDGEAGVGLANLIHFCGFWGGGVVPNCLAPGPGVTRAEE